MFRIRIGTDSNEFADPVPYWDLDSNPDRLKLSPKKEKIRKFIFEKSLVGLEASSGTWMSFLGVSEDI